MYVLRPSAEQFLKSGQLRRIARCWKLVRKDGGIKRFTNHSSVLEVATSVAPWTLETFTPVDITMNRESYRRTVGVEGDTDSITGFMSAAGWTVEDVRIGLYKDVRVDVYDVDFKFPFAGPLLRTVHFMQDVEWSGEFITFRMSNLGAFANVQVGRNYAIRCDAELADARCAKDISGLLSGTRTVSAVISGQSPRLRFESNLTAQPDGFWKDGNLTWLTGNNAITGLNVFQIKESKQTNGEIRLMVPTHYDIEAGDTFTASPGCNKLVDQNCRQKFNNVPNHRGFPFMTGFDKIIAGPDSTL